MSNKTTIKLATFLIALAAAVPAQSATTVLGSELGYACYIAAVSGRADVHALQTCTQALEDSGLSGLDRAGTFVNRGVVKLRRKAYANARTDFNAALRLVPNLGEAFVNRGASFVAERRFLEALVEINHGLELGTDEPEKAYFNRAIAHEGLDNLKQAYFDYRQAMQLRPNWEEPRLRLDRFRVRGPN